MELKKPAKTFREKSVVVNYVALLNKHPKKDDASIRWMIKNKANGPPEIIRVKRFFLFKLENMFRLKCEGAGYASVKNGKIQIMIKHLN